MRARVYKHFPKSMTEGVNVYSIVDKETGKVVGHERHVLLSDCSFTVQPAGNKRTRDTQVKNVHAWVEGDILATGEDVAEFGAAVLLWPEFTYNPYEHTTFVDADGAEVARAQSALMTNEAQYFEPNA